MEEKFDPRSYRSDAIDMALHVNDEEYQERGPSPREICREVRRHTMSKTYFTMFGLIELVGTSYGIDRLHGITANLQNDSGVTTILPLAMDELAARVGIAEDMSPSASLLVATSMVLIGTLCTPPAPGTQLQRVTSEKMPEFVEEEDIDVAKAKEEKKDDGYLDDKFPE